MTLILVSELTGYFQGVLILILAVWSGKTGDAIVAPVTRDQTYKQLALPLVTKYWIEKTPKTRNSKLF